MKTCQFGQSVRLFLLLVLPFFFAAFSAEATAISTKQSGAWTSASTWEGNVVPTNFQEVIIKAGHTVTRSNAFVCQATLYLYGTLVYTGSVTREFYFGTSLELQGTLVVQNGSLFADGLVYGNGTFRQTGGTTTFGRAYVVENTDIQGGSVYFQNTNNGNLSLDHLSLKNATLNANGNTDVVINLSMNWNDKGKVLAGTNIRIEPAATLTFDGGNSSHYNEGFLLNHGTMNCSSGAISSSNGPGYIGNFGLWNFNVQANANSFVGNQYVENSGGQILKTGPGGVEFSSSGEYHDANGCLFHVQAGGANVSNADGNTLDGVWQVDANASMIIFSKDLYAPVPFTPTKFINNGLVYGRIKFTGGAPTTVEGNGKFDRMEIDKYGSEVNLGGSPEILTDFYLSSGRIVLNQYDLRLGKANVSYSSQPGSFIQTNGIGSCVRSCAPGADVFFPIGNGDFAPFAIRLSAGSTQDFFKVRVTDGFYGEYTGFTPVCSDQVSVGTVGHNWYVSEQVPGGSVAAAVGYWLPAAERTGFDRSNCSLGRYSGGDWQANTVGIAEDLPPLYAITGFNINTFGLFGVFDAGHSGDVNFQAPLPTVNAPICEWSDLQLQANTSPNAEVQWAGPNGYQSSQANPVITGIQLSQGGNYVVKASQYGCPEKQAVVTVQVNAEPTPTIIGNDHILPGESVTLTAYGGSAYAWNTGETTQAITVAPSQTTDYQVTATNPSGCTATATFTVQVSGSSAAQEATDRIDQMQLVPNPATEATMLVFESAVTGEAQWSITDARGAQLVHQKVSIMAGSNLISIPLSQLADGAYQVSLLCENEVKTVRLMKVTGK